MDSGSQWIMFCVGVFCLASGSKYVIIVGGLVLCTLMITAAWQGKDDDE
jgi:hypothetical protein